MTKSTILAGVLVALVSGLMLGTESAESTPIVTSANREVQYVIPPDTVAGSTNTQASSTTSGSFNQSVSDSFNVPQQGNDSALADQNSSIAGSVFSGTGHANVVAEALPNIPTAHSFFDVFFDLTVPHSFLLTGSLSPVNVDGGTTTTQVELTGPGTNVSFLEDENGLGTLPFSQGGLLGVGSYHLLASVDSSGDGGFTFVQAGWDFTLTLQEQRVEVPAPATILLFGMSLVLLVGVAQRR
jgi:hypothetical protein